MMKMSQTVPARRKNINTNMLKLFKITLHHIYSGTFLKGKVKVETGSKVIL